MPLCPTDWTRVRTHWVYWASPAQTFASSHPKWSYVIASPAKNSRDPLKYIAAPTSKRTSAAPRYTCFRKAVSDSLAARRFVSPTVLSAWNTGTCGATLLIPFRELCVITCDALMAVPLTAPDVYPRHGKAAGRDADSVGHPRSSDQSACGQRRGNDPKDGRREASPARLPAPPDTLEV